MALYVLSRANAKEAMDYCDINREQNKLPDSLFIGILFILIFKRLARRKAARSSISCSTVLPEMAIQFSKPNIFMPRCFPIFKWKLLAHLHLDVDTHQNVRLYLTCFSSYHAQNTDRHV